MTVETPVREIKGVGNAGAAAFSAAGLHMVGDLIQNFPRRYDDYSHIQPITDIKPGVVTIKAQIKQAKGRYVRRGMHITEAVASDETGSVRLVWFNQPYRAAALNKGADYFISGQFELSYQRLSIMNPSVELASDFPVNTARIVPIYRETKNLKSLQIRRALRACLPAIRSLPETLPTWLIKEQQLVSRARAVESIHFPSDEQELETARKRLGFEEVFHLTLAGLLNKYEFQSEHALAVPFNEKLARTFVGNLPFELTDAQRKATWQIYLDMQKTSPMNRLLEGDVGSGKTVVAAMAALMAINTRPSDLDAALGSSEKRAKRTKGTESERKSVADNALHQEAGGVTGFAGKRAKPVRGSGEQGFQAAFMAPTELLARQHAETLHTLLKPLGFEDQLTLLVGSLKPEQKRRAHQAIKSGKARLIIGTHALIQEKVDMHQLVLVIVDEQHRFGVEQRKKLQAKAGHAVHVLNMTATPIPRTLALSLYGELDISIIATKPANRKPIITKICSPNSRETLYKKIDKELEAGRQAFVVAPLISESKTVPSRSAELVHKELSSGPFQHRRLGLLHGKMKPEAKQQAMQDFIDKKLDMLVATTVIEVGVDVPNATVMLLENADRFGLAQIHQLRGRVGRSEHQGYCYLMMSDSSAPPKRLRALETLQDGFRLAELDLEIRGPGAIYGTLQHGALDLRIAQLTDVKLISQARQAAQEFIDKGEDLLNYEALAQHVERLRAVTNLN